MHTVTVLCQKGGVGKTTLALHLATAAIEAGLATILLDTDPQSSAAVWRDNRTNPVPEVVAVQASRLDKALIGARNAKAHMVIIDTPPNSQTGIMEAAKAADVVLIPCRPAILDLQALSFTRDIVKLAGRPAYVVLNMVQPNSPKLLADAQAAVASFGLQCAPVCLHDRAAYRHAMAQFQTVDEVEPNSKAAEELASLYSWLSEQLEAAPARRRLTA